jgi:mono/diheme cytochrome c family protein
MLLLKFQMSLLIALIVSGCSVAENRQGKAMTAVDKGRSLVITMGCNDCHTTGGKGDGHEEDWLTGSRLGFTGSYGTVYPTNLRLLVNEVSEHQWLLLIQRITRNSPMALTRLPSLTDEELTAVYRFIRQLGPKGEPAPERLPPGVMPTTDFVPFPLTH